MIKPINPADPLESPEDVRDHLIARSPLASKSGLLALHLDAGHRVLTLKALPDDKAYPESLAAACIEFCTKAVVLVELSNYRKRGDFRDDEDAVAGFRAALRAMDVRLLDCFLVPSEGAPFSLGVAGRIAVG